MIMDWEQIWFEIERLKIEVNLMAVRLGRKAPFRSVSQ